MIALSAVLGAFCSACAQLPELPAVERVDLPRFMGDWYVIAHIPTFVERHAYNAVESYVLRSDGSIQTTFRYRNGAFDAPVKFMHPVGFVHPDSGNAVWSMQFLWPIEAEYRIAYLDPDYRQTIIARSARDYAWIMARTPTISDADYAAAVTKLRAWGYAVEKLRRVPQQWPETAGDPRP